MCLTRSAHGLVPNHEVFQGPFPVDIRYETAPTPGNYRRYFDGFELPAELSVWHVDTTDYMLDESLKPGTVSSGWGFEDSPDAEIIAHGINSKGPSEVALGRHGSLFLWGFACEPARMTPSGRNAFLNAICYIRKFDHAPRLVRRTATDRRWALQRVQNDPAALAEVKQNLEFLRQEGRQHVVDEDCKALGISNRDIALLEHCIAALERGEDVERSQRLLTRYTGLDHANAAAWRAWLDASRPHLFFSDVGGFRFFAARQPADAGRDQEESESDEPVTISVSVSPEGAAPGEVVTIDVKLVHAPEWHTYVSTAPASPYDATRCTLKLPVGWTTVGRWSEPAAEPMAHEPNTLIATGTVHYRLRLRVGSDATPGKTELPVRISYVTCDEAMCLPPSTTTKTVTLQVLPPR